MEPEILKRGRWKEAFRKFLLFVSLCCLFCVSFSSDLTSSISYAELLLDPCPTGGQQQHNNSKDEVTGTAAAVTTLTVLEIDSIANTTLLSTTNSSSIVADEGCGGFGSGASNTAWVASIYSAIRVGTAWITGITFEVLGARKSAILGVLLFSVGSFGSSFANELYILYFTRGLISGIGGGLLYALPTTVIDKVFSSHKRVLMALAFSSSGIGAVLLALAGR
eukprot:scpid91375/ scgid30838/ 